MFVEAKFFHKAGEGSGGGDSHNKGSFLTPEALRTAYPTAEPGDFAIVESTDTVWVWDSDGSQWKDADQKGQVTSVNGQTGAVTLTIPAAQVNSDWNASSGVAEILNKPTIPAAIQVSTLPTAAASELDKIYQFIGTTDANYTNGCFYKCVVLPNSTYTWQTVYPVDLLQYPGDYYKTLGVGKNVTMIKSGRYTPEYALAVGDNSSVTQNYAVAIGAYASAGGDNSIAVGEGAKTSGSGSIQIGITNSTNTGSSSIAIGSFTFTNSTSTVVVGNLATASNATNGVAVGSNAKVQARSAIQLGSGTNSEAGTLYIGSFYNNVSVNYKLLDADGTIPKERLANVVTTPSTAPVLAVADWSSNTQTITVTGVTATNTVFVAPAPASAADYAAAGILCTAQAANSLTFTCTTVPTNAITLSVVILG